MAVAAQKDHAETAPPGFMHMDEVNALISERIDQAMASMAQLLSQKQNGGPDAIADLAKALTGAISEANNRGKRNAVPVEEMERRETAMRDMFALINDLNERGETMEYRLSRKVVLEGPLGPQLIEPIWQHPVTKKQMRTTIACPGPPNDAMEPINENARRVFALFEIAVGGVKKNAATLKVMGKQATIIVEGAVANNDKPAAPVKAPVGVRITGRDPAPEEVIQNQILGTIARPAQNIGGAMRGMT